jgi:hypothetical protein
MLHAMTNFEFLKRKYEKDLDVNKHASSRKKCFMRVFKDLDHYFDLNTINYKFLISNILSLFNFCISTLHPNHFRRN